MLDSLIIVPLEQGENKITFKFLPKYYVDSLIITGFGIVLLVFVFLSEVKKINFAGHLLKKVQLNPDDLPQDEPDDEADAQQEQTDEESDDTGEPSEPESEPLPDECESDEQAPADE